MTLKPCDILDGYRRGFNEMDGLFCKLNSLRLSLAAPRCERVTGEALLVRKATLLA